MIFPGPRLPAKMSRFSQVAGRMSSYERKLSNKKQPQQSVLTKMRNFMSPAS